MLDWHRLPTASSTQTQSPCWSIDHTHVFQYLDFSQKAFEPFIVLSLDFMCRPGVSRSITRHSTAKRAFRILCL